MPGRQQPGEKSGTPTIGDDVPAMVWAARPDMSCEFLSRAWLDFTGYSADQALGEGWSRGVHPEDLARWLDTCVRAFDAREPFEIEYRLRRRDGEYRWVLDRGQPRLGRDGALLGYVGAVVDVHERKRAEGELARSLERERRLRIATEEASRLKDGFLASVLEELRAPVQAIATWAGHLRTQVPGATDAAQALDGIERNARMQSRILANLVDLSRVAANGEPPRRTSLAEPLLAGVRVLVVESDAAAREHMLKVLAVAGAETRAAGSSTEALEALCGWRPDVMLSDLGLRGEDGYLLIRAVRSLPAERGGCLRAAALMPDGAGDEGRHALGAGYDAQLLKPVEPVALLATVARLAQPSEV